MIREQLTPSEKTLIALLQSRSGTASVGDLLTGLKAEMDIEYTVFSVYKRLTRLRRKQLIEMKGVKVTITHNGSRYQQGG